MNTSAELARYLARTLETELPQLRAVADGPATQRPNRPAGGGWSQREELGHLVDSAVNNHARFVRAQLESPFVGPDYDQQGWVDAHRWRDVPWHEIVELWHAHNRVLVPLVAHVPDARLATLCTVGDDPVVTFGFLIDDYVLHMRHHLDQILRRTHVTRYPR